jgi:hypothetical protein
MRTIGKRNPASLVGDDKIMCCTKHKFSMYDT